jgi:glutamyl-tRNA(Gln) amidotransferase subunit D
LGFIQNIGEAGVEFLRDFVDAGAKVSVYTTLNPAGIGDDEFMEKHGLSIGDLVRVVKREGDERITFEGLVMPPYELSPGETLTIKLDNGYNIGILIDAIENIEVVEKAKEAPKMEFQEVLPRKEGLPGVTILGTGGTIASRIDYKTGAVHAAFTAEELAKAVPEIFDIANITPKLLFNIMSEDMKPEYWKKIAHETAKALNSGEDGVIIAHGTDTLGYLSLIHI